MCVGELCGFSVSKMEQRDNKHRPKLSDLTGFKLDRNLGWVGAAVEDRESDFLICLVEFMS